MINPSISVNTDISSVKSDVTNMFLFALAFNLQYPCSELKQIKLEGIRLKSGNPRSSWPVNICRGLCQYFETTDTCNLYIERILVDSGRIRNRDNFLNQQAQLIYFQLYQIYIYVKVLILRKSAIWCIFWGLPTNNILLWKYWTTICYVFYTYFATHILFC